MSKMKKRIETLLKLGAFAAAVMYGVNMFIEYSAEKLNLLDSEDGEYFNWSQGTVYYNKIGEGSPLLLVHDLTPSSSAYEWHSIVEDLTLDHTVYVVDLPGCGRSDKNTQDAYINYYYVRFIKEFIDEVIGEKTDVIATGLSSSFVIMAASIHDSIIGHITMINPKSPDQLSAPVTVRSKAIKTLIDCPILGSLLYYIDNSTQQTEYLLTEKLFYNPFLVTSKMIRNYYKAAHMEGANGKYLLSSIHGNYMSANISRSFAAISNPVTIIFGKEVPGATSIASSYEMLNKNTKSILISKTKYLPQLEAPEKLLYYICR